MPTRRQLTPARRRRVLEMIARGATDTEAAEAAGISRYVIRYAKKNNPSFAEEYAAAYEAGLDPMLAEARVRAIEGTPKLILDKDGGEHFDVVKSDNLLMFLIKQRDPSFRENHRVEIGGVGGGPVPVEVEGGRATSLGDVLELARQFGIGIAAGLAEGARAGVDAGDPQRAIPAAADVLSDPAEG